MPDPATPSLSSCVLCGRDVDDGVVADFGGLEVEVHDECAEAGLEGMDLASSHADPDAADGDGGADRDEASGSGPATEPAEGDAPPETEPAGDDATPESEPSQAGTSELEEGPAEDGSRQGAGDGGGRSEGEDAGGSGSGAGGSGSGAGRTRDPDWTRISDFT